MSAKSYKAVPELSPEEHEKIHRAHNEEKTFLGEKELRKSISAIKNTIKNEELRLRTKYEWLRHQNLLGLGWFLMSLGAIGIVFYLYIKRMIHWSLAIPTLAIAGSIMHELEHDLIHNLYFQSKKWVQHLMYVTIYLVKMHFPPWTRKAIHLRHHMVSGQKEDIEERLIGSGRPLNVLRWLVTIDPMMASLILDDVKKDNDDFDPIKTVLITLPTVLPMFVLQHLFINYIRVLNGWTLTEYDPALLLPMYLWPYVRDLSILVLLPNVLRQASLNLIASYSHYYGDVPKDNVYYQNQILDHWLLWPLQAFCFNFGATHIIHHFIPNQPFYLRQMLAPKVLDTMEKNGIRRNDFGIVSRSNRYYGVDRDH